MPLLVKLFLAPVGSNDRMHKISIHSQLEETGLTILIVMKEGVDLVIDKKGTALESDNQQSKSSKTVVPLFGQCFPYQFHCNLCQRHDISEACGRRQAYITAALLACYAIPVTNKALGAMTHRFENLFPGNESVRAN